MIEEEIAEAAAAAKLRLRFDKVVVRLVGRLKTALADRVPDGEALIFTCTAPIRLPGKTAAALEELARGLGNGELRETVHSNQVRVRRVIGVPPNRPKVLGFVHNPESDAGLLVSLIEARLLA